MELGTDAFLRYVARMSRWIITVAAIVVLVAGAYWFLQHKGVQNCYDNGGEWSYSRWTCVT